MKYFCFVLLLVVACSVYCEEEKKDEKEKEKKDAIGTVIGIDLGTTYSWYVFFTSIFKSNILCKKEPFGETTMSVLN